MQHGLLELEALERFAAGAFIPNASVEARPTIESDTTLIPLRISHASVSREGSGGSFRVIGFLMTRARLDGREVLPGVHIRRDVPLSAGPAGESSISPSVAFYEIGSGTEGLEPVSVSPGNHTIAIVSRYYIISAFAPDARPAYQSSTQINDRRGGYETDEPALRESALAMIEVSSETTFTVAPSGEPTVRLFEDPD